jgi:hypothetical protein
LPERLRFLIESLVVFDRPVGAEGSSYRCRYLVRLLVWKAVTVLLAQTQVLNLSRKN